MIEPNKTPLYYNFFNDDISLGQLKPPLTKTGTFIYFLHSSNNELSNPFIRPSLSTDVRIISLLPRSEQYLAIQLNHILMAFFHYCKVIIFHQL